MKTLVGGTGRLAKVSAPRLVDAIARERAFAQLDRKLAHPVAWIVGAPGSGKTTLAATYAHARGRALVWYQVDRGDEDVASFFHYFEMALSPGGARKRRPLPRFVPEMAADLAGFTRRFARQAWARVPRGGVVVLDNVHEAPAPTFMQVLAALFEEIPEGLSVIVASRTAPPAELAALVARRTVATLPAEVLRFTTAEAASLLATRRLSRSQVKRMWHDAQGWAAGLLLMSECDAAMPEAAPASQESLFGYFATQVVDRLPAAWQRFLLLTAALPKVTVEIGNALARSEQGATILETLRRQNLFVDRREQDEPTYQYHPLFRRFLRDRARATLTPLRLTASMRRAAALAQSRGWTEDAMQLLHEARDWQGAARLLESAAPALLAQGRAHTLERWAEPIPESLLDARPSLWFELGHARMQRDEIAARHAFQRAYVCADRQRDEKVAMLAAGAVLETIFTSFRDWTGGAEWCAKVRGHFPHVGEWAAPLDRLRAYAGWYLATMLSADRDDADAERAVRVLLPLLADASIDVNDRLRVAAIIVDTCGQLANRRSTFAAVEAAARGLIRDPGSSPLLQARYLLNSADEASFEGDPKGAEARIGQARAIIERHGWAHKAFVLACRGARIAFYRRDLEACEARLAEVDRLTEPGNVAQATLQAVLHYLRDLLKGDLPSALENARTAARGAEAQLPSGYVAQVLQLLAFAQMANGRFADAAATFERSAALTSGVTARQHAVMRELALAMAQPHDPADGHLARGLALAREIDFRDFLPDLPHLACTVCSEALRRGIEPVFIRDVIVARRLAAPDPDEPAWPWPIRLRTLGGFGLERDGMPIATRGKSARRLHDLLKLVVASGHRELPAGHAIATLWPELEGDQAKAAFNVALHRLRKLLGHPEAIVLDAGRIGLSTEHVWVDAYAFERNATQAEALFAKGDAQAGERAARTALALYGGHFLHSSEDAPWHLVQRSRLSAMYTRVATLAGHRSMDHGRLQEAQRIYERALDLEPLAEETYRHLMRVHITQGEPAEALRVYRRCREMLSIVLGVEPSAETERLRESLLGEIRNR